MITGLALFFTQNPDAPVDEVRKLLHLLLPSHLEDGASSVHALVDDLLRVRTALGFWSAIGFVWFCARLFGALRSALAQVFDIETERGIIAGKLFDIRLTITCTVLVVVYLALNAYLVIGTSRSVAFLSALGIRSDVLGGAEYAFGRILSFIVVALTMYGLYRYLPIRRIHNAAALVGALASSVLFEIARQLYSRLTGVVSVGTMYTGTLYAIVSVVFWAYYSAVIFLLGGEYARVYELRWEERNARVDRPPPVLPASEPGSAGRAKA